MKNVGNAPHKSTPAIPNWGNRALFWILAPLVLVFVVLNSYTVITFTLHPITLADENVTRLATTVNLLLNVVGFIGVGGVIFGFPYGIYCLVRAFRE